MKIAMMAIQMRMMIVSGAKMPPAEMDLRTKTMNNVMMATELMETAVLQFAKKKHVGMED